MEFSSKFSKNEINKFIFILDKLDRREKKGLIVEKNEVNLNLSLTQEDESNQVFSNSINSVDKDNLGILKTKKNKLSKIEFINLIKRIYELNPDSKGKKRKRTLTEVLILINKKIE